MPVRILAFETSTRHSSVVLMEGAQVTAAGQLDKTQPTAAYLVPTIKRLLSDVQWAPRSIEVVSCSLGPGSFTGLRIGLVTAKIWARFSGAQLIGVPTFDVVAQQAHDAMASRLPDLRAAAARIVIVIPAARNLFYLGAFDADRRGELVPAEPARLADSLDPLHDQPPGSWLSGTWLERCSPPQRAALATRFRLIPADAWYPRAETVARLARRRAADHRFDSPLELEPIYIRPSYVDEHRAGPETA